MKCECTYKIISINRKINCVLSQKKRENVTRTKMNMKNHTGHVFNNGNSLQHKQKN